MGKSQVKQQQLIDSMTAERHDRGQKMRLFAVFFKQYVSSFPSRSRGILFCRSHKWKDESEGVVWKWVCECHHWAFTLTNLHPYLSEKESHLVTGKLLHFVQRVVDPSALLQNTSFEQRCENLLTSVADFNTIWQAVFSRLVNNCIRIYNTFQNQPKSTQITQKPK